MTHPIVKIREKPVSASVFENTSRDGKKTYRQVVLQTGFKQSNGEWKNSQITLFDNQIPYLISCLTSVQNQLAEIDKSKKE